MILAQNRRQLLNGNSICYFSDMTRLVFTFLMMLGLTVFGQTSVDSTTTIDNVKYGVHKVEQGQTLYSLSRDYKVSFTLIKRLNKDKLKGLDIGDYVFIPLDGQDYPDSISNPTPKEKPKQVVKETITADTKEKIDGDGQQFTVPKGATVYGVCQKFSISKEDLYRLNPEVESEGLKEGQVIFIREQKSAEVKPDQDDDGLLAVEAVKNYFENTGNDSLVSIARVDSSVIRDSTSFHLALMLPFQTVKQISLNEKNIEDKAKEQMHKETEISLEFYNGIQLALDSLRKKGLNAKVFVYDTKADSNKVKEILSRSEMATMDMIIGPLYARNFEIAAEIALNKDISIVSPFIKNNEIVSKNRKVIRCQPNFDSKLDRMLIEAEQHHLKDKIIVVYQTKNLEKAKLFERRLMAKALEKDSLFKLDITLAEGMYQSFNHFSADSNVTNAIFILDNEESFTTRYTTKLHLRADDYNFEVYAMDDLFDYKNIEVAVWDSLQMNLVGQMNAAQGVVLDEKLYQTYFDRYYTEPSNYALLGYDIAFNLLMNSRHTNLFSPSYVAGKTFDGNAIDFRFQYSGKGGGIFNNYARTYHYHNFQFQLKE